MRTKTTSAVSLLIVLVLLLAACGGGGDQSSGNGDAQGGEQGGGEQQGGEEQQGGGEQQGGQQAGEADAEGAPQEKIAIGTIESVDPESRKVVLKPDFAAQGDQLTFNVRKNAEIRVNDQEAELSEVQQGQSAQIEYVTKNEVNRALSVEIVGGG